MTCFHQNIMFLPKAHPIHKFADYFEKYYRQPKFKYLYHDEKILDKYNKYYPMNIPCGQCIGCRLDHSTDWATRIYCETLMHDKNCFVTFTYTPQYLPLTEKGECTLKIEHIQKFWHDLRQKHKNLDIKYVIAGEYGTNGTKRAHYHACIFGYEPKDLKFYKYSKADKTLKLYKSKELTKLWKKGIVIIGKLEYRSACYVARYVQKKAGLKPKHKIYNLELDINEKAPTKLECYEYIKWLYEEKKKNANEKTIKRAGNILFKKTRLTWKKVEIKDKDKPKEEFILSSLRPAIGLTYWNEHKEEIKRNSGIFIKYDTNKFKLKPIPRYFKKKWKEENPEEYFNWAYKQQINAQNQILYKISKMKLPSWWSLNQKIKHIRKLEENNLIDKLKKSNITARNNFI